MKRLTAKLVDAINKPGKYHDGDAGLYLYVQERKGRLRKSYMQRVTVHGKRVEIGLGSRKWTTPSEARAAAQANRKIARTGGVPRRKPHRWINFTSDATPRSFVRCLRPRRRFVALTRNDAERLCTRLNARLGLDTTAASKSVDAPRDQRNSCLRASPGCPGHAHPSREDRISPVTHPGAGSTAELCAGVCYRSGPTKPKQSSNMEMHDDRHAD